MNVKWIGSPNYTEGREGNGVDHIVIHWMDGDLASADSVFQNTNRQTSAHYGIEDGTVHQYVKESDTAWHAGNFAMNLRSIGIEHSAQPGRDASAATCETSAQLVAQIAKTYGVPLDRQHVIKHSEVPYSTECCGTIPIDAILARAKQLIGSGYVPAVVPSTSPTATTNQGNNYTAWGGTVTITAPTANVRSVPTTQGNAPLHTAPNGTTESIIGYTHGESVDGNDVWLKAWNGNWIWSGATSFSPAQSGTVTVTASQLNVRTAPNTSAPLGGCQHLYAGQQVQYAGVVTGESVTQLGVTSNQWYKSVFGNYFWAGGCK
jgi:N-acetylmuramoyl-L-alanine amidase CwlA